MPTAHVRPDAKVAAPSADVRLDAEALFREARRRRRRRRIVGLGAALVALAGVGWLAHARATKSEPAAPHRSATKPRKAPAAQAVAVRPAAVAPRNPYGLTVGSDGTLYIVDTGRNQVLERLTDGKFKVVAGNRKWGRSGDGGPATRAELKLETGSGIVAAKNGTLYFADTGNRVVRAVLPNGTIETVAGNGHDGFFVGSGPALDAAIGNPDGLAIAPDGDLYIASGDIVRLTPDGVLHWVAGSLHDYAACGGIDCNPASEYDFTGAYQLAFDAAGDLFVSDGNGFGLYEIGAGGALSYLGQFRGDGAPGALATTTDGTVVGAWRGGVTRLVNQPSAANAPLGPLADVNGASLIDYTKLDAALGHDGKYQNHFIGGDGVSVAPDGDLYIDTNDGNAFTDVSALLQVGPNGVVNTVWKS